MKTKILFYWLATVVLCFILTGSCKKDEDDNNNDQIPATITDIDGNVYHTLTIGTQVWLVENLKVTHYQNGESIPNVMDPITWSSLTAGAYCNYNNIDTIADTYGHLYNWQAVNDIRKIAPAGWHVPTNAEWIILENYFGGSSVAGGKIKEADTIHWNSPNVGATNESGFTGLPGGNCGNNGIFSEFGRFGFWWSATENDQYNAWYRSLCFNFTDVYIDNSGINYGYSIRCLKD
jgi:uncharacterized protein (TIGR02145 family)